MIHTDGIQTIANAPEPQRLKLLEVSGPTSWATVRDAQGRLSHARLYVREDGVVVARPVIPTDE